MVIQDMGKAKIRKTAEESTRLGKKKQKFHSCFSSIRFCQLIFKNKEIVTSVSGPGEWNDNYRVRV